MPEELDPALRGLEPRRLWEQFDALRRIPRPSLHEERVRKHLRELAADRGWAVREDLGGNIVLAVAGQGAGVDAPPLALQGHMDMVCVKDPDVEHDFYSDPIQLRRAVVDDGGRARECVRAAGTTLGSDNGLGMAAALAIAMDPTLDRPPLELLFTADEETGMTGARQLDPRIVTASRLLNLDAEEHGSIYLSCAGGRELVGEWELERETPGVDEVPLRVRVSGLRGGHSGVDIHEGRANALTVLFAALAGKSIDLDGVRLGSCDGGGRANAIPRFAQVVLWCAAGRAQRLGEQLGEALAAAGRRSVDVDPGLSVSIERVPASECPGPISAAWSRAALEALARLPDGVISWSTEIDGLVETSNNVGVVETSQTALRVICLTRSSRDGAVESVQARMRLGLESAGATTEVRGDYPGWEADLQNPLLARTCRVYEQLFGSPPEVKAIHAGLECGILRQRVPGMQMVAFGPEIRNAHTPDEAVMLDTVEPFWRLVRGLVRDLCD